MLKIENISIAATACMALTLTISTAAAEQIVDSDKISAVVSRSNCAAGPWKQGDRGTAPNSYLTGMGITYAKAYCEITNHTNTAAQEMARPNAGKPYDVFGYFIGELGKNSIPLDTEVKRLRAAFTIAVGVGMNESTGNPTAGAYIKNKPVQAEAGLFQLSYDSLTSHPTSPWLAKLYKYYQNENDSCLTDVFVKGLRDRNEAIVGAGAPADFQRKMKSCPALSVEYGIVEMRIKTTYYGTVIGTNPHGEPNKAQFVLACYKMFEGIEKISLCK